MRIVIKTRAVKVRIPLPQKPPKREAKANAYGGKKTRREARQQIRDMVPDFFTGMVVLRLRSGNNERG